MLRTVVFACLLSLGLVMSGTAVLFSGMVFLFVIVAVLAFNVAGGLTRPSGTYVFFFATNAVIVGLCVKVFLWEPAELYMLSPLTTMAMYTGGILAMYAAAFMSRKFSRSTGFLEDFCSTKDMRLAAIGCVVGGILFPLMADYISDNSTNTFFLAIASAANQLDRFLPLAIILGTTSEIKLSGGKRSSNLWVWTAGLIMMFNGFVLNFSKEALFTAPVCWLLATAALGFRFRLQHLILFSVFVFASLYYFVPYCQYGRTFRFQDTKSEQIRIAFDLLSNLDDVRAKDRQNDEAIDRTENVFVYFSKPMGLFDRLTMMGVDDKLVTATDQKGTYGLTPIWFYFANLVPKFIWKNKPFIITGNTFAHDIGWSEDDFTTGISFSPVVEGYHEAKWFGVFVVCPLVWLGAFLIMDSIYGDVRKSPWGLLVLVLCAHNAPEGLLQGAFYIATYATFAIVSIAFVSAYLMPLLGHFVSPPKRPVHIVQARRPAMINARPAPTER